MVRRQDQRNTYYAVPNLWMHLVLVISSLAMWMFLTIILGISGSDSIRHLLENYWFAGLVLTYLVCYTIYNFFVVSGIIVDHNTRKLGVTAGSWWSAFRLPGSVSETKWFSIDDECTILVDREHVVVNTDDGISSMTEWSIHLGKSNISLELLRIWGWNDTAWIDTIAHGLARKLSIDLVDRTGIEHTCLREKGKLVTLFAQQSVKNWIIEGERFEKIIKIEPRQHQGWNYTFGAILSGVLVVVFVILVIFTRLELFYWIGGIATISSVILFVLIYNDTYIFDKITIFDDTIMVRKMGRLFRQRGRSIPRDEIIEIQVMELNENYRIEIVGEGTRLQTHTDYPKQICQDYCDRIKTYLLEKQQR